MNDFFCNRCSLQFDKKYDFDLHLFSVHGEKIEVKKETICEEKVQEPKISEKEFSNQKVEKHLKCDVCNSVFKTKPNLKRHIQSVHEGLKFRCSFCSKTSTEKFRLRKHILALHRNNPDAKIIEIKSTIINSESE